MLKTSEELGITERQRVNLAKLTTHVRRTYGGRDRGGRCAFYMGQYGLAWDDDDSLIEYMKKYPPRGATYPVDPQELLSRAACDPCGTAACFAGHGPMAGVKPKDGENWCGYVSRVFVPTGPVRIEDGQLIVGSFAAWCFLFGETWPDDPMLAARRGAYFLQRGLPDPLPARDVGRRDAIVRWMESGFLRGFRAEWKEIEKLSNTTP